MQSGSRRKDAKHFTSSSAECYLTDDKERLLAVVETGFGDLQTFDGLVRSAFVGTFETVRDDDDDWLVHAAHVVLKRKTHGEAV